MTPKTGFIIANRISILLAVLLLTFLFTCPQRYLAGVIAPLRADAALAQSAVLRGDMAAAQDAAGRMQACFAPAQTRLQLFLNNDDITALNACINAVRDLAALEDDGQMLEQLHTLKQQLDTIEGCEEFSLSNLF